MWLRFEVLTHENKTHEPKGTAKVTFTTAT